MGNTLCPSSSPPKKFIRPPPPNPNPNPKPIPKPDTTPSAVDPQPQEINYIEDKEENDVVFAGPNNAFQFKNYKTFKRIKNINKLFVIQRELGKGAFGEVSLATH